MPVPAPKIKVELLAKSAILKINSLPYEMFAQTREVVNSTALNIHRNAVENLSKVVDRGRLRSSLTVKFYEGGLAGTVGTDVKYAPFVEFGTGPKGSQTNKQELPTGWAYHTGNAKFPPHEEIMDWCRRHGIDTKRAFLIARSIARKGLPARPFLFPAWFAEKDAFLAAMKTMIGGL